MIMFWGWLAGMALSVILELMTGNLSFFCLSLGCAAAAILALFLPQLHWAQVLAFSGLAAIALTYVLPRLANWVERSERRRQAHLLVGLTGSVEEAIEPDKPGTVRIGDTVWPAQASTSLAPMSPVVVRGSEETMLLVEAG